MSSEYVCDEDVTNPEDLAWADSCLEINDLDLSKTDWNSMKDALLEILNPESDPLSSSAAGSEYFSKETDDHMILSSSDEPEIAQLSERTVDDPISMHKEEVADKNKIPQNEEGTSSTSCVKEHLVNPFLPNYKDDILVVGGTDSREDFGFLGYEMETTSVDIFKVWDLAIPAEEGELLEEFYRASADKEAPSSPHYAS